MSNYSWVDFKAPCESFYNKMRKKLQFLHSILINWNYPGWSLFPNSILGREYLKAINEFINKKEHTLRRKSICSFKTDCPLDIGKKGYAVSRATNDASEIIYELSKLAKTIDWEDFAKHSPKDFLTQFLLNPDELPVLKRLILNDSLLSPVVRYLGEVPVLQTAAFWHSTNTSVAQNSSQFFHIDGEGLEQVKIFIPLDNIDENQGPFTLIPAEASDLLVKKLLDDGSISTRSDRVDDEVVRAASDFIVLTGSLGDIFYVDTNHCYHFGSRPNGINNKPRLLLQLHFTRHTSADLPTFNRGYSVKSDDGLEDLILKPLRSGKLWLFFKGRYKYFPIDRFLKGSPESLSKIDCIAK